MADQGGSKFRVLLILGCFILNSVFSLDMYRDLTKEKVSFTMDKKTISSSHTNVEKRAIKQRIRRYVQDERCHQQERELAYDLKNSKCCFINKHHFQNETKFTMSLAWAGENTGTIIVSVTEEELIFARPSSLYRSTNDGKSFTNINSKIENALIRKENGLQKNPNDANNLFIVAHNQVDGGNSIIYITKDGGENFQRVQLPFMLKSNIGFHPSKANYMLALDEMSHHLYISKDGGVTWKHIHEKIVKYRWDSADSSTLIYAVFDPYMSLFPIFHAVSMSENNNLLKSTDLGDSWKTIHTGVYTFGLQGRFLYASIKKNPTAYERLMKVSTDKGETWAEAQLPTITTDRFYSILDMSEELIFMHVDNPGDTGHGTLYTSDATGIIFSESLEKHLYPNYNDLTDFYKVNSMRGVYLASTIDDDDSIRTVISFDRGGEWKKVQRPAGMECPNNGKQCSLQIHNAYSISRGINARAPLSVKNAPGIILVHGHVADSLRTTAPDVFVTSDGGYNWIKALDGPHHYQIADHGGLLVAVPADTHTPSVVKYSTDEGRCWHEYKFTNDSVHFTGLLTEPGNKAMSVSIWGYGEKDRQWRIHVIDFTKMITRQCAPDDYEEWTPHSAMGASQEFKGCLLGQKESFMRLKKDSLCHNGHSYQRQTTSTSCKCQKSDYECDYGFMREEGSDNCVKDPKFGNKPLDICLRGHVEQEVSVGYRKIPGDLCSGGFKPSSPVQIDLHELCNDGDKNEVKQSEVKPASGYDENVEQHALGSKSGTSGSLIAVIVIIVVLVAFVLFLFIAKKYHLFRRNDVSYRYSMLNQTEDFDYDNDVENAIVNSRGVYHDTSDDEETRPITSKRDPVSKVTRKTEVKSYHDDSDVDMLN